MAKILIITSRGSKIVSWQEREVYIKEFTKQLNQMLNQAEVFYATYSDISFLITKDEIKATDHKNGLSLSDYDFVQFKNWHGNLEFASVIARYLSSQKIKFVNKEVKAEINIGKLAQAFVLRSNGLPTPDTFYAMTERLGTISEQELNEFGFQFPLILKQVDGSRGDNNHLCSNVEDLHLIITDDQKNEKDHQYVIQNFIPNEGDYRFLFIGTDNEPMIFKRRATSETHLNNTSKGGSGELLDNSLLPSAYISDARAAAELLRCQIAGVDIIVDKKTDQHYVLEINSTPALATGFMIEEKIKRFTTYIKKETQNDT